ncbi:MAG: hypothetical protein LBB72_05470 [Spirochaetaceae bacterium]|nr:hypothetical protein [Spirochaetaceae bacterium]
MRSKKFVLTALVIFTMSGAVVHSQVQSVEDTITPTPQFQDHGGVTPWFWIGVQTVFSGGYNIETGAAGFRNYGGDNNTYASFNLAFVDSHYQTPKFYEVPRTLDPNAWTGHFVMMNFTTRINSWEQSEGAVENNAPAWLAEITGMGYRIGFFTQAANLVGGLYDYGTGSSEGSRKPITKISGGNKVLNLGAGQLGQLYYEKANDTYVTTTYTTSNGAIWYTGYEQKDLWNVYLTMLSEGNVSSDVSDGKNKGIAGVVDFGVSPFGVITDEEAPLTFNVSGNFIGGFGWKNTGTDTKNVGFGLKGEAGVWLVDNWVLSPVVAFDGKLDMNNEFFWKAGGGLTFQFSGMRWVNDDWGDLKNNGAPSTAVYPLIDYRYENNKILKYAYAQVYGAYSEERDLNMLFRIEEPDGNAGFHEKLGLLGEFRWYNMMEKKPTAPMKWEAQGRVSWDVNIQQYLITPYLRGYINDDSVLKLRLGAYANIIPFTCFELAYTSANLNKGVNVRQAFRGNPSYKSNFDAGRIELIVILKSDDIRPQVPKRMSDWNYPSEIQNF